MSEQQRPGRRCSVLGSDDGVSSSDHYVQAASSTAIHMPEFLCAEHWLRINDQDEPWMWDTDPGDPRSTRPGVRPGHILMGQYLVDRRIVVANQPGDIAQRADMFSPQLGDHFTRTLIVEGTVFGSDQRAHVELALTPETVDRLRRILGPAAG